MTDERKLPGLIVRAQSGLFHVETDAGMVVAELRGRLTKDRMETDAAALGDRVWVQMHIDGTATIEEVEERRRVLSRRSPGKTEVEQVIVANPDQLILVFACAEPDPNFRMLDRLLVVAEREQIPAIVCANKIDLVTQRSARAEFGEYKHLGYGVIYTSAIYGKGIRGLRKILRKKISVLAGPSGAGKTSLLNAVQPGLELQTKEISEATGKGQHSTVVPKLISLKQGGYVADTPGLKAFALWDIEPEEVDAYFPEMRHLVAECDFSDCTHEHEPGCAVIAAVEARKISPERYDSYLRIRHGEMD